MALLFNILLRSNFPTTRFQINSATLLSMYSFFFFSLHLSLWSIWNYFSMNNEGNSGSLMSRRGKWSEPSFRNINLAATHNLGWRRKRIKQRNIAAEKHSGELKTEEEAEPRPQEVAIQGFTSAIHTTSSAETLHRLKGVCHHSHCQKLPAIFFLGTYTMYNKNKKMKLH